jgi:hypothetical protein
VFIRNRDLARLHAQIAAENAAALAAPPKRNEWNTKNTITSIQVGAIFALILVSLFSIEIWANPSFKPISCPVGTSLYVGDNGYMECDNG